MQQLLSRSDQRAIHRGIALVLSLELGAWPLIQSQPLPDFQQLAPPLQARAQPPPLSLSAETAREIETILDQKMRGSLTPGPFQISIARGKMLVGYLGERGELSYQVPLIFPDEPGVWTPMPATLKGDQTWISPLSLEKARTPLSGEILEALHDDLEWNPEKIPSSDRRNQLTHLQGRLEDMGERLTRWQNQRAIEQKMEEIRQQTQARFPQIPHPAWAELEETLSSLYLREREAYFHLVQTEATIKLAMVSRTRERLKKNPDLVEWFLQGLEGLREDEKLFWQTADEVLGEKLKEKGAAPAFLNLFMEKIGERVSEINQRFDSLISSRLSDPDIEVLIDGKPIQHYLSERSDHKLFDELAHLVGETYEQSQDPSSIRRGVISDVGFKDFHDQYRDRKFRSFVNAVEHVRSLKKLIDDPYVHYEVDWLEKKMKGLNRPDVAVVWTHVYAHLFFALGVQGAREEIAEMLQELSEKLRKIGAVEPVAAWLEAAALFTQSEISPALNPYRDYDSEALFHPVMIENIWETQRLIYQAVIEWSREHFPEGDAPLETFFDLESRLNDHAVWQRVDQAYQRLSATIQQEQTKSEEEMNLAAVKEGIESFTVWAGIAAKQERIRQMQMEITSRIHQVHHPERSVSDWSVQARSEQRKSLVGPPGRKDRPFREDEFPNITDLTTHWKGIGVLLVWESGESDFFIPQMIHYVDQSSMEKNAIIEKIRQHQTGIQKIVLVNHVPFEEPIPHCQDLEELFEISDLTQRELSRRVPVELMTLSSDRGKVYRFKVQDQMIRDSGKREEWLWRSHFTYWYFHRDVMGDLRERMQAEIKIGMGKRGGSKLSNEEVAELLFSKVKQEAENVLGETEQGIQALQPLLESLHQSFRKIADEESMEIDLQTWQQQGEEYGRKLAPFLEGVKPLVGSALSALALREGWVTLIEGIPYTVGEDNGFSLGKPLEWRDSEGQVIELPDPARRLLPHPVMTALMTAATTLDEERGRMIAEQGGLSWEEVSRLVSVLEPDQIVEEWDRVEALLTEKGFGAETESWHKNFRYGVMKLPAADPEAVRRFFIENPAVTAGALHVFLRNLYYRVRVLQDLAQVAHWEETPESWLRNEEWARALDFLVAVAQRQTQTQESEKKEEAKGSKKNRSGGRKSPWPSASGLQKFLTGQKGNWQPQAEYSPQEFIQAIPWSAVDGELLKRLEETPLLDLMEERERRVLAVASVYSEIEYLLGQLQWVWNEEAALAIERQIRRRLEDLDERWGMTAEEVEERLNQHMLRFVDLRLEEEEGFEGILEAGEPLKLFVRGTPGLQYRVAMVFTSENNAEEEVILSSGAVTGGTEGAVVTIEDPLPGSYRFQVTLLREERAVAETSKQITLHRIIHPPPRPQWNEPRVTAESFATLNLSFQGGEPTVQYEVDVVEAETGRSFPIEVILDAEAGQVQMNFSDPGKFSATLLAERDDILESSEPLVIEVVDPVGVSFLRISALRALKKEAAQLRQKIQDPGEGENAKQLGDRLAEVQRQIVLFVDPDAVERSLRENLQNVIQLLWRIQRTPAAVLSLGLIARSKNASLEPIELTELEAMGLTSDIGSLGIIELRRIQQLIETEPGKERLEERLIALLLGESESSPSRQGLEFAL